MNAITGQSEMINTAFKKMPLTVGGALKQVKTSMMSTIDTILVQSGAMGTLANAISGVAQHFGTLAIVATTIGAVALANVVIGASAAGTGLLAMGQAALTAGRAMAVAAFSNPFTAVIAAVGLAAAALYEYRDAVIEVNGQQQTIGDTASDVWETVKTLTDDAWQTVSDVASGAMDGIKSAMPSMGGAMDDVMGWIKSSGIDAGDVIFSALGIKTVDQIISAFRTLGNVVSGILSGIAAAANQVVANVQSAIAAVKSGNIMTAASSVGKAVSFNGVGGAFSDAFASKQGNTSNTIENKIRQTFSQAQSNRQAAAYRQEGMGSGGGGGGAKRRTGGGGGGKKGGGGGGGGKAESKVGGFDDELTALKRTYELAHDLREMGKAEEIAFWKSKLLTVAKGSKDAESIEKKIAQLSYDSDKTTLKNKLALAELSAEQLVKIENEKLDEELKFAQFRNEIGSISGSELLAVEADIENRRFELAKKAMLDRVALLEKDPTKNVVEIAKIHAQIEDLTRAHTARSTEIERKAIKEKNAMWSGVTGAMEGLWDKGLDALMNGTLTWKNATRAIVADLGGAFMKMGADTAKNWIKDNAQKLLSDKATQAKLLIQEQLFGAKKLATKTLTAAKEKAIDQSVNQNQNQGLVGTLRNFIATIAQKLAAKMGFATQESAIDATSVATSGAASVAKATTAVGANAVTAASGAAASQASIPWVGPVLAIAAMAAMMAAVGGMTSKIPSARGGYDIPAGMNPLTQLHEQEMVLPAKHADVIRSLAANGSASSGENNNYNATVNYHDNSGKLTPEELRRNSKIIGQIVKSEMRSFRLKT